MKHPPPDGAWLYEEELLYYRAVSRANHLAADNNDKGHTLGRHCFDCHPDEEDERLINMVQREITIFHCTGRRPSAEARQAAEKVANGLRYR